MSRSQRVKKVVPPPEPPRDTRLVALAEQAERAGWGTEWQLNGPEAIWWWLQLRLGGVVVDVFAGEGGSLSCYANYTDHWNRSLRTPAEALRSAYADLGVALDQAEDAFGGAP